MMKITAANLQRAAILADNIQHLELMREAAEDTPVDVPIRVNPSARVPLGSSNLIGAVVPATTIRAVVVDQLTPLYTELRNLGFELQL